MKYIHEWNEVGQHRIITISEAPEGSIHEGPWYSSISPAILILTARTLVAFGPYYEGQLPVDQVLSFSSYPTEVKKPDWMD